MTGSRYRSIDIIKGVAICMILLVHSRQGINGLSHIWDLFMFGQMGCQLFFVISGVTAVLSMEQTRTKKEFLIKRWTGIVPGYYIVMFITHFLNYIMGKKGLGLGFAGNNDIVSVFCNLLLLHGWLPFCNNNVMAGGWFVGTIVILYFLAPFLYALMKKMKRPWVVLPISFGINMAIAVLLCMSNKNGEYIKNNSFYYFSFITQLPCFLLGMYWKIKKRREEKTKINFVITTVGLLFSLAGALMLFFGEYPVWPTWLISYKYIICCTVTGIVCVELLRLLNCFCVRCKLLECMGKRSYYIYLIHAFWVWTLPRYLRTSMQPDLLYCCMLPIIFIGTYLNAGVLEKMCRPIEQKIKMLCLMNKRKVV